MTIKEILERAKILLTEKGWIQGCYARDINGNVVDTYSENATQFCLMGAIYAAGLFYTKTQGVVFRVTKYIPKQYSNLVEFNDASNRTKEEVIQLLDCAIKGAK